MGADWTYTGNAENGGRRAQRERFARAAFQAHGPGSNPGRRIFSNEVREIAAEFEPYQSRAASEASEHV